MKRVLCLTKIGVVDEWSDGKGATTSSHYAITPVLQHSNTPVLHRLWCQRYSPVVGLEEFGVPDSLLLDVTGCAHLFGGEGGLARQVAADFRLRGLSVRGAMADTIGAAWALAHYGRREAGRPEIIVVPAGEHAEFLRPLPVKALRLPAGVVETLEKLDVRRIGQLLSLPRDGLLSRLGPEVLQRLDQALGRRAEWIVPERPPAPVEARWSFEHPISHRQTIEAVLQRLVGRIVDQLASRGEGVQSLRVHLTGPQGEQVRFSVGMLRPSASEAHVGELLLTRLGQLRFFSPESRVQSRERRVEMSNDEIPMTKSAPIDIRPSTFVISRLSIRATATALLKSRQEELFETETDRDSRPELGLLIDRLSSQLGEKRVLRPYLYPDAQPERASRWQPLIGKVGRTGKKEGEKGSPALFRPLRLKSEPCAIKVTAAAQSTGPGAPPVRFSWRNRDYTVIRCWGPERIETGWWRGRHVRRDYYRVETETGRHFWLFRRIREGDWFLHGEFE